MLFLHTLLFSLLGTSILAIPVPGLVGDAVEEGADHLIKLQINGIWAATVSEHRLFYLTWYSISVA